MTEDELDFLRRVKAGTWLKLADREQDRVRQRVRKLGYAEVVMSPRRWVLTERGKELLRDD